LRNEFKAGENSSNGCLGGEKDVTGTKNSEKGPKAAKKKAQGCISSEKDR